VIITGLWNASSINESCGFKSELTAVSLVFIVDRKRSYNGRRRKVLSK
jgi:hypothetical protein